MLDPTVSRAAQFIRTEILSSRAYAVPDATGLIKLDAMENPYGFPAHLKAELLERVAAAAFNRYPVPSYVGLKAALRKTYSIPSAFDIMVGNGSDELIDIITKAVAKPGATIMAPEPGFVMYAGSAMQAQVKYVGVPLNAHDFSLDLPAMLSAIERQQPAVVWVAVPNNPTGNCFSVSDIEAILAAAPGLVVIDEAYEPFSPITWMPRLAEFPNLIVMRTVSKWGLAGIRLGYMAGSGQWLAQFEKIRPPYNVNVVTDVITQYCLEHSAEFVVQCKQICEQREILFRAAGQLPNVTAFKSEANFVLARFNGAGRGSAIIGSALKADGLLVKDVSAMHPLLSQCLRLSVGTAEQTQALIASLQKHCLA
jgi:histidinol-phosphate aminotransferase